MRNYEKNYDIRDYRISRWDGFKDYYVKMMYSGDCDPSYPSLNYIADRMEINLEQRYWLSFIYGTNYCVPTTYYIFNEFPDYENVDINRMQRWWDKNKSKTFFQTDRAKVKNFDLFVKIFESYRSLIGKSQVETFSKFLKIKDLQKRYREVYEFANQIYYFGRFTLFNYLESLNELTNLKTNPDTLELKEAKSCRNGLCFVCNKDEMFEGKVKNKDIDYNYLDSKLELLYNELKEENPEIDVTYYSIETCLCAYKKLFTKKRYFGYYIDRQLEELYKLQDLVNQGVEWSVMWDFRKEFFDKSLLGEYHNWKGIRKENMNIFMDTGRLYNSKSTGFNKFLNLNNDNTINFKQVYSRKVEFKDFNIYNI